MSKQSMSVDSIKRNAKDIKKALNIPHHLALDKAAKQAGFANYTHFLRQTQAKQLDMGDMHKCDRLPSPSETALSLMRAVQREDVSIQEITLLVQTDPALSGRVIQLSNSAAFWGTGGRGGRPNASIKEGIALLGIKSVSQLATSLSLIGRYRQGPCALFDYGFYWSFALARAVAFQILNATRPNLPQAEAFSLGLLADIGRLALASIWPDEYDRCLAIAHSDESLEQLERNSFGLSHNCISLMLLSDWGFPELFLEALKLEQQSSSDQTSRAAKIADTLTTAKNLAQYCMQDADGRAALLPALLSRFQERGLSLEKLENCIKQTDQQWIEQGKLIGINTEIIKNSSDKEPHPSVYLNLVAL